MSSMSSIIIFRDNKKYTFIPENNITDAQFNLNKESKVENDIYEQYDQVTAQLNIHGKLLICNDVNKLQQKNKVINKETYDDYVQNMELNGDKYLQQDEWIYNIINGISEQEKIIAKTSSCIIIPNYTWNENNITQLQVLGFPIQCSIRTLRDLTSEHIPLLLHIKSEGLCNIENKYGLHQNKIKVFINYRPSTYHLHIHFVNIDSEILLSSVEHSHYLDYIIFNLQLDSNYYKKIILDC